MVASKEVGSFTWSPDNSCFVTCSEDQSSIIWDLNQKQIQTLRGHLTAVTSVEWQHTVIGEIIATCADDHKVMLWKNPKNSRQVDSSPQDCFELYHVFNTSSIGCWHTLTYLALEKNQGNHVSVVTQSGHLLVWNFETKENLGVWRIHLGSVEGLIWHSKTNLLATCGGDCCLNLIKFSKTNFVDGK